MPQLDESTIRKAAAWQDFKEGQSLHQLGTVNEAEHSPNGWKGSVKIGARTYRPTVTMRTPTWFDAKCSCPRNTREAAFCPHAIAVGLQLIDPIIAQNEDIKPVAIKIPSPPIALPILSWKISFLGPWQKSLEKSQASLALESIESQPCPADQKLSTWLLANQAGSSSKFHLALNSQTLPGFLEAIIDHTRILAGETPLSIDSGLLVSINHGSLEGQEICLTCSHNLLEIGESYWKISEEGLQKIGSRRLDSDLTSIFRSFREKNSAKISLSLFLSKLDSLQSYLDFSTCSWFENLQFLPAIHKTVLELSGSPHNLKIQLHFDYASEILPKLDYPKIYTRNLLAENEAQQLLIRKIDHKFSSEVTLTDSAQIQKFLTISLPSLPSEWIRDIAPGIRNFISTFVFVSPKIQTFETEGDELRFEISFVTDSNEKLSTSEIRQLLRSKSSSNPLHQGKKILFSDDIEALIDPLFEQLDLYQENGQFIAKKASAEIIQEMTRKLSNSHNHNDLKTYSPYEKLAIPDTVLASLRPYQELGFSWLADRLRRYHGALLADDMGLGKTLQTISCLEYLFTSYPQLSPALIIVTTSLLGNWKAEYERFAPGRKIIILHGVKREALREKIQPGDVVLTTYATLARDLAWHLKQEYLATVIDEASLIRNPDTDHSKAVAKLNSQHRIALTGTPIENSARDLWSIFRYIQPGWLGTRKDFKERYEQALQNAETAPRTAQLLRLKTSPFILRRTKQEVAPELPSKIHIDEFCELSSDQAHLYREIQRDGQQRLLAMQDSQKSSAARFEVLSTLLRLRQTCCDLALFDSEKLKALPLARRSAKLERLLEITEQSIASGSRILVFSQFRTQLIEIEKQLEAHQITSLRLDGKTQNRSELVERFQSPNGPSVFLISLKAGAYGLNLTAADVVIHFDPWWNPAAEAQATDRAHRIGQSKPVTVFRFLTRGTVEEKVIELQSSKKTLADSLDESLTATDSPAWSLKELEKLLQS